MDKVRLHVGSDRKYYSFSGTVFTLWERGEATEDVWGVKTRRLDCEGTVFVVDERTAHKEKFSQDIKLSSELNFNNRRTLSQYS